MCSNFKIKCISPLFDLSSKMALQCHPVTPVWSSFPVILADCGAGDSDHDEFFAVPD